MHVHEIRQNYSNLYLNDCESVAGTGKCVVSLPPHTAHWRYTLKIAKLVYMQAQGGGTCTDAP